MTDVGTDILNGEQRIAENDPIWGCLMLGFVFLPAGIVCAYFAIGNVLKVQKGIKAKLKWILISLILFLPSTVVFTLFGFVYVIYAGSRKMIDPGWREEKFRFQDFNREFSSVNMRMLEILFESSPQAILGIAIKSYSKLYLFLLQVSIS